MATKEEKYYLTSKGVDKIKKELDELRGLRLVRIKGDALDSFRFGDVDPEFLDIRDEISRLEYRISEMEDVLEHYKLIKTPPKKDQNKIHLGARVLIEMDGEIEEFTIVGTFEVDLLDNKISNESPIGKTLLGKRVGEVVEVETPIVRRLCKIIKIEY